MKRVYCFLLIFALVFAIAACHATGENSPLGDGLYPIVTHPSDTAPGATTLPTVPFATDATVNPDYSTVPTNPGDNIPVPSQPTNPENNQDK